MDLSGAEDKIIPPNLSNTYPACSPAPGGATCSSEGFYYETTGKTTSLFAAVNGCAGGAGAAAPYPVEYEGERGFGCVEPYGACSTNAAVVQCQVYVRIPAVNS